MSDEFPPRLGGGPHIDPYSAPPSPPYFPAPTPSTPGGVPYLSPGFPDPNFPQRLGDPAPPGSPYSAAPIADPGFPGDLPQINRPTPFRRSRLRFNVADEHILLYPWAQSFTEGMLAPSLAAAVVKDVQAYHDHVQLLPSGSWCIASWEMLADFENAGVNGIFGDDLPTVIPPDTGGHPAFKHFPITTKIPTGADSMTIEYNDDVKDPGPSWYRKRRAKGTGWGAELGGSIGTVPKPFLPSQHVKMRRIAETPTPLGANTPLFLRFMGPLGQLQSQDALLSFYFGGATRTQWPGSSTGALLGGEYCLTLFGDGTAWLLERTGEDPGNPGYPPAPDDTAHSQWRPLDQWRWEEPANVNGRQHLIVILPEFTNTISFVGSGHPFVYRQTPAKAGYFWKPQNMTGPGPLRLDQREDLRFPFQFGQLSFPHGDSSPPNVMQGVTFELPIPVGEGTRIYADLGFSVPNGSFVTDKPPCTAFVALYDAETNESLPTSIDTDGIHQYFTTLHNGHRKYSPVYTLQSDDFGHYTPFVRSANYRIEIVTASVIPGEYATEMIHGAAINGPDLEEDCDHALLTIHDYNDKLPDFDGGPLGGLNNLADFRVIYETTYDGLNADLRVPIFDGIMIQASGKREGKYMTIGGVPVVSPSPKWKTWRLQLAGHWSRLQSPWQVLWQTSQWAIDDAAAFDDSLNSKPPWLIVDIIDDCLKHAGYPDAQRRALFGPPDIAGNQLPHSGPRLFANGKNVEDYWAQPGVTISELIHHLCKDYLGARLIWDEAIPGGSWRLVYPPLYSGIYHPRWAFTTNGPEDNGLPRAVHLPQSYPAETIFIRDYSRRLVKPEANLFFVATADADDQASLANPGFGILDYVMTGKGETSYTAFGVNYRGADFTAFGYPAPDPAHVDYLPYGIRPFAYINPLLTMANPQKTLDACAYICRRQMDSAGYGRTHLDFDASLVLHFDPDPLYEGNPRKLRPFDQMLFIEDDDPGDMYLVTNVSSSWTPEQGGDIDQNATYTAVSIPDPLSF